MPRSIKGSSAAKYWRLLVPVIVSAVVDLSFAANLLEIPSKLHAMWHYWDPWQHLAASLAESEAI